MIKIVSTFQYGYPFLFPGKEISIILHYFKRTFVGCQKLRNLVKFLRGWYPVLSSILASKQIYANDVCPISDVLAWFSCETSKAAVETTSFPLFEIPHVRDGSL